MAGESSGVEVGTTETHGCFSPEPGVESHQEPAAGATLARVMSVEGSDVVTVQAGHLSVKEEGSDVVSESHTRIVHDIRGLAWTRDLGNTQICLILFH